MTRVLVALGGNALQRAAGAGSWEEAVRQLDGTIRSLASVVTEGHQLILTHGNGPQIGALLRQNELALREVPARPMYVLGAETQGQIGYLIQQELSPALKRAGVPRTVIVLVSRMEVSPRDPAFKHPTKPVGRFYSDAEARLLRKREGWVLQFDGPRGGWRRVVPSPNPLRWLEAGPIQKLLNSSWGHVVIPIVAGGGGIPVVRHAGNRFEGVEAVIDKDLAAVVVARELSVETLAIVTDVPGVAVGFRKPWERWLGEVSLSEIEKFQRQHEFGEGSMSPKIEAARRFMKNGGSRVLITDIPSLGRALRNEAGTRIVQD
ncbi:MAG: carbamate kinase [Thermoplasmata archaeon]